MQTESRNLILIVFPLKYILSLHCGVCLTDSLRTAAPLEKADTEEGP